MYLKKIFLSKSLGTDTDIINAKVSLFPSTSFRNFAYALSVVQKRKRGINPHINAGEAAGKI